MSNKLVLEIFVLFWLAILIMWVPTADAAAVCQSLSDPGFIIVVPDLYCPIGFVLIDVVY